MHSVMVRLSYRLKELNIVETIDIFVAGARPIKGIVDFISTLEILMELLQFSPYLYYKECQIQQGILLSLLSMKIAMSNYSRAILSLNYWFKCYGISFFAFALLIRKY